MKIQYTGVMIAALATAIAVQPIVSAQAANKASARVTEKTAAKKAEKIATQNALAEVRPDELIALLRSNAPKTEKVKAFKPLAVFGSKEAVPAIAPYLADEELSSWARIALEAIPDPSCDEALRKAEGKLKGRLLIGVINSIGVRRDAEAVGALVRRLGDADVEVAIAATAALGRIGGDTATQALEESLTTAPPALRSEAADAVVRCAEKYLTEGKKTEALRLYELVSKAAVPQNRVLEGLRGLILARDDAGLPLLVNLLKSADKRQFAMGLKLSREVASSEVTDALLAELGQAAPPRQAVLVLALADRADPKARNALLQAAKTGSGDVRIASIRGLKTTGDASCGPVLLDAALDANTDVSQAAVDVLAEIPGKEIDELMAARLQSAAGDSRLLLIDLAGRRHIEAVAPILRKLADDPNVNVRAAALTALGATISANDLEVLIERAIARDKPAEAKAAEKALRAACARMSDREAAVAKMLDAIARAQTPAKCTLLGVLVTIGGEKALKAVAAAAEDSNTSVRRAGYRALGEWTSADAGPEILALVKNGDPELRIGALRAYIRIARQFSIPNGTRMAMFQEIMSLAQRDEERRLALDILKQIRTSESLSIVVGYLDQPQLCDQAATVAVTMSEKMVASNPADVAAAMKRVLEVAKNKDAVDKARGLLNRAAKK
jgi:HEAT repeat protein